MATKTETKTATATPPKVVVTVSAKIVSLIKSATDAAAKATARFVDLGLGIRGEAQAKGYSENEAREMVVLSYREAMGLDSDANEKATASFDLKYRPDVSKVMRLAFPTNTKAATELAKAVKHNADGDGDRIGVNNLLEMARGNVTYADVVAHKRAQHLAKTGSRDVYTVEKFAADISGVMSKAKKAGISIDAQRKAFDKLADEYEAEKAKASAPAKS